MCFPRRFLATKHVAYAVCSAMKSSRLSSWKTWIASALHHGEVTSPYRREKVPEGCERAVIFVETDETYVVEGPFMSAAAAARELGVSAGRITRMLDSGILDGYRSGRRTFITQESVSRRK